MGLQQGADQNSGSSKGCSGLRVPDKGQAALQSKVIHYSGQREGRGGEGQCLGLVPLLWKQVTVIVLACEMSL